MTAEQRVESRTISGIAKRMGRNGDAAFLIEHLDQAVALQHPRSQIEPANHFVLHAEQHQMTKVGISFDSLEDRNLKSLRQLGIPRTDLSVVREQAMLGEANRAKSAVRALRKFKILLRRDVGVGRQPRVDVQVGDHALDTTARRRCRAPGYGLQSKKFART